MNKKGNIVVFIMLGFIAFVLVLLLPSFISDSSRDMKNKEDLSSNTSFIATVTSNETLSPIGEGIESATVIRQNSTWLNFDGVNDYLFIPDNSYVSVSFWVNDSLNNWFHFANASTILYENAAVVGNPTLNAYKKNSTGWYFGINESGYFPGNIDTIKFYNDTLDAAQVSNLYADGR